MIRNILKPNGFLRRFARDETGVAHIEFLFMLPTFFLLFMSAFEGGMLSTRHVVLERSVDLAVREVRIGRMPDPTHTELKTKICENAGLIKDCMDNLQIEMVKMDVRNWDPNELTDQVACIDRGEEVQPAVRYTNGDNNELMVLIVCALFDPISVASTWGRSPLAGAERDNASNGGTGTATNKSYKHVSNSLAEGLQERSEGMYALVATSAFVMEPFK